MTMADLIVVMKDGLVEQRGRPLDLYDRPANTFVAGFIGSPAMNFLPGVLRRAGGAASVELDGGARVIAPAAAGGTDGQRVTYGVRPEHLTLGGDDGMAATVVVVEPTGMDTQVFGKVGGVQLTAVFRERHEFRAGETIHLVPDHERTHLFDAESGKTLMHH
jgi:multiple sugar transport system ATP-binding protein